MARSGVVAVVARRDDRLAAGLAARLAARSLDLLVCEPHELADLPVVLDPDSFALRGRPVASVVWRVGPGAPWSASFAQEDRPSADSEAAAAWLAALSLPGVYAVNRYSACVWYGGSRWPAWRGWLRGRGVAVSPLRLGAGAGRDLRWRPCVSNDSRPVPDTAALEASGGAKSAARPVAAALLVAGRIMSGTASRGARAAAEALTAGGVRLARVIMDEDDRVFSVDTNPQFRRGDELTPVVERLAEVIHERVRAHRAAAAPPPGGRACDGVTW